MFAAAFFRLLRGVDRDQRRLPADGKELRWIERLAVDPHLIVQMRAGAAAGTADRTDALMLVDAIADAHENPRQMGIARLNAVAVIDFDHPPVGAVETSEIHHARRRAVY